MSSIRIVQITLLCGLIAVVCDARAGDWPQLLGPSRNGVAVDPMVAGLHKLGIDQDALS